MRLDAQKLLNTLQAHPLLYTCFADYVTWFCTNAADQWEEHRLIKALCRQKTQVLSELESGLTISRKTLGLTESDFATQFAFTDDLLTKDPAKIHDLLAEVLFVNNLDNLDFTSIGRPQVEGKRTGRVPLSADFTARRLGAKFAIEVKTIRPDRERANGRVVSVSPQPALAQTIFHDDVVKKIERKERHVIRQLQATALQEHCDHTLLAIYFDKEEVGALMRDAEYTTELTDIKRLYPEIDYFIAKSFNGGRVVDYPKLPVCTPQ
jgi:hypothetical protein